MEEKHMEKRKDWLIVTAIAAIVFAILSLILMVKLNSTLGELKELKAEKRSLAGSNGPKGRECL